MKSRLNNHKACEHRQTTWHHLSQQKNWIKRNLWQGSTEIASSNTTSFCQSKLLLIGGSDSKARLLGWSFKCNWSCRWLPPCGPKLHLPMKTEIGGYHSKTTCIGFLSHLANNVHLHTILSPQYSTSIILKSLHPFRSTSISHWSCPLAQSYLKNFDPCIGSIYLLQPYIVMVGSASQSASHPANSSAGFCLNSLDCTFNAPSRHCARYMFLVQDYINDPIKPSSGTCTRLGPTYRKCLTHCSCPFTDVVFCHHSQRL